MAGKCHSSENRKGMETGHASFDPGGKIENLGGVFQDFPKFIFFKSIQGFPKRWY